jgi:hypothetical protein
VFDKDIMIYCISKLMRMKNDGEEFGPVVRLSTHDMLVETNRPTNNLGYERLLPALNRLRGVVINTTIATGSERTTRGFGLIDQFEYNRTRWPSCRNAPPSPLARIAPPQSP